MKSLMTICILAGAMATTVNAARYQPPGPIHEKHFVNHQAGERPQRDAIEQSVYVLPRSSSAMLF